ncbi:MAG: hypothetical protein HY000_10480 [Planctomycetes bacterium]|nr:hypothetical protein [Planctomycetota bacterium]
MPLADEFPNDSQGRRFSDVLADERIPFVEILHFFDDPDRKRRMVEAERDHDRPALAGVVRELEARPDVHQFFSKNDGHTTTRFRQAVGVAVRMVMTGQRPAWRTTGRKGSLGVRAKVPPRTARAAAYHNSGGLALWFTRAERYELLTGMPYRPVAQRAQEIEAAAMGQ